MVSSEMLSILLYTSGEEFQHGVCTEEEEKCIQRQGMYLRVPIRTSMNSSVVMSSRIMTSQLCSLSTEWVERSTGALVGKSVQLARIRRMVFSSVLVSFTVAVKVIYMDIISTKGVERSIKHVHRRWSSS